MKTFTGSSKKEQVTRRHSSIGYWQNLDLILISFFFLQSLIHDTSHLPSLENKEYVWELMTSSYKVLFGGWSKCWWLKVGGMHCLIFCAVSVDVRHLFTCSINCKKRVTIRRDQAYYRHYKVKMYRGVSGGDYIRSQLQSFCVRLDKIILGLGGLTREH